MKKEDTCLPLLDIWLIAALHRKPLATFLAGSLRDQPKVRPRRSHLCHEIKDSMFDFKVQGSTGSVQFR